MIKKMKYLSLFILLGLLIACFAAPASAAAIKGSNVWDEDQNMPSTYTWTPAIYSGLWYDLDRGIYTENITLKIASSDRQINAENAEYITEYENMRFAYADWGSYRVIGWQGEPYFAGYTRSNSGNMSTTQFTNSNISTLSNETIFPVLLDSSDERRIGSGGTYSLENGYRLTVSDINESGREFRLILERNGNSVKNETVSNNTTFVYERSLGDVGTIPVVAVHVKGLDGTTAVIDGIFQVSESETDVNEGRKVGAMEIRTVNDTRITMRNPDRIRLNADNTVTLMGHIKIDIKDTSRLKFELISDPKTDMERNYSDRGMVYDSSNTNKTWNGMNFPGFTYDYDNSKETENLSIDTIQRSVPAKQILYATNAYNESFNYSNWGSYQAINLGGENYFAGYLRYSSSDRNNTTNFTDSNDSLLRDGNVSKVLINNATERQYNTGSEIRLEEGYTLHISNITDNGSRANMVLKRDGNTVKEAKVRSGDNFIYEANVGDTVIPVIATRVTDVFEGTSSFVKLGGFFQISTDTTDVGKGMSMGKMSVEYTSNSALIFTNTESINLARGSNITLMENLSLHVADSDEIRLFPFSGTGSNSNNNNNNNNSSSSVVQSLKIGVPETIFPNDNIIIKVVYNDSGNWRERSGATVKVNNNTIGQTDSTGSISYTIGAAGVYEFKAEQSGYTPSTTTKTISGTGEELQIVIPDYIFTEDSFRLYVKDANNTNMTGASVYKNGAHIGTTNDNGMINVTADSTPGLYKLTADKTGYRSGAAEMRVLEYGPYFAVTNSTIPEDAVVNKTIRMSMTIENVGKEKSTQDVVITADNQTETTKVTLSPGDTKKLSFSFKPETTGNYTIEVANQTFTITVVEKQPIEIPWKWIIIGIVLLIIIVGAALALIYYNEREDDPKKRRREPESKSIYGKIEGLFGGDGKPKSKSGQTSKSAPKSSSKPPSKPANKPAGKPKSSSQTSTSRSSAKPKTANKFSSSGKPPELKNSQKKARKDQGK